MQKAFWCLVVMAVLAVGCKSEAKKRLDMEDRAIIDEMLKAADDTANLPKRPIVVLPVQVTATTAEGALPVDSSWNGTYHSKEYGTFHATVEVVHEPANPN